MPRSELGGTQPEWWGAGLPVAKRRDADGREALFAYFLTRQKVSRQPGRDPARPARPLSLAARQFFFDSCLRFLQLG